jgi:anaphase-promoting complex subunit 6
MRVPNFFFQALSINPINAHVLELLNLALEASAEGGPLARLGEAGRSEEWRGQMRAHAAREAQLRVVRGAKDKEREPSSRAMFGDMQEGESGMSLG